MRCRTLCTLVIPLLFVGCAKAQSLKDDARVDSALKLIEVWLDAQVAYQEIPGMSAGIVHDQILIWSRGFGFANLAKKIPASPTTIYSICSISKLFTTISVMQLRDEGRLRLDDSIDKYLSWYRIKDTYPDAPKTSIGGILTHSAGLPREADFPYWSGPDFTFPTREQVIEKLPSQEELYPADTYYQYSNLGLTLAGEVVAAVSGQSYADYVQQHILDPLELKDTSPEIPTKHREERLAVGYSQKMRDGNRRPMPFLQIKGVAPAAGFASTVGDLARFASWQFRLIAKGGKEVLAANTLKEMQRVHFLDQDWRTARGLGFSVSQRDGKVFVGHGGSCPGYRTDLSISNKDKVAVIVMANASDVNPATYSQQIFDIVAPRIAKALESAAPVKKTDPGLDKFVGRYQRPLGGETEVLILDGELVLLPVPTDNPQRVTKLKFVEGNTFRRVRDDGELGEKILFEQGPDGKVTRMIQNSNYALRVN